jgi:hypothetical protein
MQPEREIWTLVNLSQEDAPAVAYVSGPNEIRLAVVFDCEAAARDFMGWSGLRDTIAFPFDSLDFALEALDELPDLGITHFTANPTVIDSQACWPIRAFVADVRNRLRSRRDLSTARN